MYRIFWAVVFALGISFSSYFCYQMWRKWDQSPIITSLDSFRYPVGKLPFPSVTVCSVNKVSKSKLEKQTQSSLYKIFGDDMQEILKYLHQNTMPTPEGKRKLLAYDRKLKEQNISMTDLYHQLSEVLHVTKRRPNIYNLQN